MFSINFPAQFVGRNICWILYPFVDKNGVRPRVCSVYEGHPFLGVLGTFLYS